MSNQRLAAKSNSVTFPLCIAGPHLEKRYSETFIENHIKHIPMPIVCLYERSHPRVDDRGRRLTSPRYGWPHLMRMWRHWPAARSDRFFQTYHSRCVESYLRKRRVGAVLAEYGHTGASLVQATDRVGIPLVVHFHGQDAYRQTLLDAHRAAYRRMFDSAAAIVAVSRDMRRQLIALGAPKEKVEYIPYGVDTAKFTPAAVAESPPVFVAVGRFVEKKAPYLTLVAFAKVVQEVPAARLIMIGDGPLLAPCRQIARALEIADKVDFPGVWPPERISKSLQQARAFVQHSQRAADGDSEGMPNTILEAQASGLPVIATRHAGIKDVVVEEETGLLVEEGDGPAMARQMVRIAESPELAARLGAKARTRAVDQYSLDVSISKLTDVIRKASLGRVPLIDLRGLRKAG
ncbi:MAG: glycosyltransferase [Pirellulaceae bacterium]